MITFKNKSVVVTGGSRGIGAATVELFAKLGADVAFNYHSNQVAAENLLKKIQKYPGNFFTQPCNIGDFDDVQRFIDQVIEKFSKIDILVNNAGIWEYGAIDTLSVNDWQHTIETNLNSVFFFTKAVVKHMKSKNIEGRIIHIASTAGQRGEAFHSHYAASKGAIISFTKSLASELGPNGILVNCVAPGWVDTDMSKDAIEADDGKILDNIPLGKIPEAIEIARPIVFLASEWASAITGEILNVNSGSVLCG
jgi:3-oxoacyl-[acyl-carrier protein] reductase